MDQRAAFAPVSAGPFLGRRGLLGGALAMTLASRPRSLRSAAAPGDWLEFRRRFVTPEGRVIDTGNGNISHSEGQGAALLFAARHDDRASFERILGWTRGALRRPDDTLLAWRYQPGASTPVADLNNASDGDLLAAWALAEAAGRWGSNEHLALAIQMGRDLLRRVVLAQGSTAVLLPGASGFLKPEGAILNPSYFIAPAFRALALVAPSPFWARLEEGGIALAEAARFGRWRLPADWVVVPRAGGRPVLASSWAPRFSYDALRVPLYLAWGGHREAPALRAAVEFWNDPAHAAPPAWADLRTDAVAPYAGDSGHRAIERLASAAIQGAGRAADLPDVPDAPNYYASLLVMMSRLAWSDSGMPEREVEAAALSGPPAPSPPAIPPMPRLTEEARLVSFPVPSRF